MPQFFGSTHRLKYIIGKNNQNCSHAASLYIQMTTYSWDSYTIVLLQANRMNTNQL